MANIAARVVLHDRFSGDQPDYETLHATMWAAGFGRKILGESGAWFHLPDATYVSAGRYWTVESASAAVAAAVQRTGWTGTYIVFEYINAAWLLTTASSGPL